MAFPFLFLALSLAAGILWASWVKVPFTIWIIVLVVKLVCTWILWIKIKKNSVSFISLVTSAFVLGSCVYSFAHKNYQNHMLHDINEPDYIDIIGTLYKSPARGQDRDYLYIKIEKIRFCQKELKTSGKMRISVLRSSEKETSKILYFGDCIKVAARLSILQDYSNFYKGTNTTHLKSQGLIRLAFTKSPLLVEKIKSGTTHSPLRIISQLRIQAQNHIEEHFFDIQNNSLSIQGAVLEALLLGERRRLDAETIHALQKSGLFHLFAISGAHIAILCFFLLLFFRSLRIPPRTSYGFIIGMLIIYALIVEGRPSVLRATLMAVLYLLGKILWNEINLINTISLSAFLLLFINPFHLFDLGFQLTFAATLSILLFFSKIKARLPKLPLRLSELLAVTLTAQLGVLPFLAIAFNRITFTAFLLNYLALPLVAVIMAGGHMFLLSALLSPILAKWIASALGLCIGLFIHIAHFSYKLPLLSYRIPTPHILTCLGYYSFLLLILLPQKFRGQKRMLYLGFLVCFFLLILYPFSSHSHNLKVTFIDVGQGDSILVEFPGQEKMLIDGGGIFSSTFDVGDRIVSPFLWRKGIKKIDYLVLSHPHPDHLLGLLSVAQNFKLQEFWYACEDPNNWYFQKLYGPLPAYVSKKKMVRGDTKVIKNVTIEILHPPRPGSWPNADSNNQSMVLRIVYGKTSFLLTGDIEIEAEKEILEHNPMIQSQVMKSPHHGSPSSSSPAFLKAVFPRFIIVSVGKNNIYGFPHPISIKKYKDIHAEIYRTDLHGAIEITSDGNSLFLRTSATPSKTKVFQTDAKLQEYVLESGWN